MANLFFCLFCQGLLVSVVRHVLGFLIRIAATQIHHRRVVVLVDVVVIGILNLYVVLVGLVVVVLDLYVGIFVLIVAHGRCKLHAGLLGLRLYLGKDGLDPATFGDLENLKTVLHLLFIESALLVQTILG